MLPSLYRVITLIENVWNRAMNLKVFIPVTDEILYERPELITSPLRPYRTDTPCFHWMATIDRADQSGTRIEERLHFDHSMALDSNAVRQAGYQTGSSLA